MESVDGFVGVSVDEGSSEEGDGVHDCVFETGRHDGDEEDVWRRYLKMKWID